MDPTITWTQPDPVNVLVPFTSSVDQALQYKQIGYALIVAIRTLPGATRIFESNSVTASAAQNIASATDIVFAAEGVAHSYAVYQLATDEYIVVNFTNAAGDATPQSVTLYKSTSAYTLTGTPTLTRPTPAVAGRENSAITWNMIPWAAAVAGDFTILTTSEGSLYCFVKANGGGAFIAWFFIHRSGTSRGNFPIMIGASSSASVDQVTWTILIASASWRASQTDGTAINLGVLSSNAALFSSWISGLDASGNVPKFSVVAGNNGSASAAQRYLGALTDVVGIPANVAFNAGDPADVTGTHRLRSFGDLMFPLLDGSADI